MYTAETATGESITAVESARTLKMDLNRIYILLRIGRLQGVKVDGEWRVNAQSVANLRIRRRKRN